MRVQRIALILLGTLLTAAPMLAADAPVTIQSLSTDGTIGTPTVNLLAKKAGGMTLSLEIPSIDFQDVDLDGRTFKSLELPAGGHLGADGQAELPTVTRLVALPAGSGVEVRLLEKNLVSLGTMTIAPSQGIQDLNKAGPVRFDQALYASAPVTVPSVKVGEPALMHGVRVVPVTFSPVAYDPATGKTDIASSMTVEVSFTGRDERNSRASAPTMIAESFAQMFEQEVIGWERSGDVQVGPGGYLMICPDNSTVVGIVEKLADWRRRQGYDVKVVTTATTGTNNIGIRNYIASQYTGANPPLEFVSLIGDANGSVTIPTFTEGHSGYNGEGDHEYTTLEGGDVLADVHLGRISVTSTSQLQTVIDKIVEYESTPDMSDPSWFTTAGLTGDPSTSGYSCIFTNQFVKQQLENLNYTQIDTIWSGNFVNQMMATVGQGESLFTYRGYWNMSGLNTSHISGMSNGQQLPFAVILTCDTGTFRSDTTCRSEAFLRASNGGGVASIGTATTGTHTRYNNCMFLGITNAVLNSGDQRVGPALTRAKLSLYNNYNANEWDRVWIWSTWNNLMGDPATEMWTAVPRMLDVDYSSQMAVGSNALPVTVTSGGMAVAGARVAVYQAGNVADFAYTDMSGGAVLSIDGAVAGDVLVTVTGQNMHPHLGQTAVGTVNRSLDFDSLTISEVSGNGDDQANPGEVLDLAITLRNNGTNSVSAASATLLSTMPELTILDTDASYGTIGAGSTGTATFQVRVETDAPANQAITLRLEASGSGDDWTSLLDLPIHGPWGKLNRLTFGGSWEPGESGTARFDLYNSGDMATSGATATLSCNSQWVTVTDADGSWGTIGVGASVSQTDLFAIEISSECYTGHLASMLVELQYNEGGTQVIEYPVVIGTAGEGDPTGPDSYGYYAFNDGDNAPEAPIYDWVEIASIGTNTGISDNSRHDDETRRFDLPFDFTYYGETYDRISICSNGWMSFGETDIKLYRNWTLPADGSPDAMICAFWDDLAGGDVYTYYDEANHRYIVQWDNFQTYQGSGYGGNCTFEIILFDPAYHAADTGDGPILIQYQNVTVYYDETTYFTTGIQDHTRTVGLTYAYGNDYAGGSETVEPNRAIAFIPVIPQAQGTIMGEVLNASASGAPIEGALISLVGSGRSLATDSDGRFQGSASVGTWDIAVFHDSFAPDTTYGVTITESEISEVDFTLEDIRGPYILNTTQLEDTENVSGPYVVEANVTDMTGVDSYALHYTSSSSGGPFTLPLTVMDAESGLVRGQIPGQADGTRVQYWITASDVIGNASSAPAGAPWPTYNFMVSAVNIFADDDCEEDSGWTVDLAGDDTATGGVWVHGDPVESEYNGNTVQTGDDHTAAPGVNCWFTGQHQSGQSAGYNDVDGGQTTLTSPIYNVAGSGSVEVSYWRWYTNNLGYSPDEDYWVVQVSNDGGANWVNVESTTASNNAWQQVSFFANDYFDTPDQLRLRFRASDYNGGSLVEAAIDDIVISSSTAVADVAAPVITVTEPEGGSIGNGQNLNVAWNASDDVGVVHARVWLSLDGGSSFDQLIAEGALDGAVDWTVNVPGGVDAYDARVRVEVLDGMEREAADVSAAFTITVGVTDTPNMGSTLALAQNHPNPFNPQTSIFFSLPRNMDVSLKIYNVQGKLVRTLVQGMETAGSHEVVWKGRDDRGGNVSSGIYFYRLTTDGGDLVRKMTLLK